MCQIKQVPSSEADAAKFVADIEWPQPSAVMPERCIEKLPLCASCDISFDESEEGCENEMRLGKDHT